MEKIFMILDEQCKFYCYVILRSNLEDIEVNFKIRKIYYDLLDHKKDFSKEFEKEVKKLKDIKIISFVYENLKYICV